MGDIVEFSTRHIHQQACFKVSSNSINFAVKARGGACIGLSKSLQTYPQYYIILGFDFYSVIRRCGRQVDRRSQRIQAAILNEFRWFWATWHGDVVKFGHAGNFDPIMAYHGKSNEIKYVTFFRSNGGIDSHVAWKVELPPVIKTPVLKPAPDGELHWVSVTDDTNVLPDGSLIGGYENEFLYIIRAKHRGSLTPGKFVPSEGTAYISWGGGAHDKERYEVLCGYDCMWVPTTNDVIPQGAVVAGYSENIEHQKLYVGRAKHLNHIIPGKVQPSHRVCYIPYNGLEIAVKNYEILVVPQEYMLYEHTVVPSREAIIEDLDLEVEENEAEFEPVL